MDRKVVFCKRSIWVLLAAVLLTGMLMWADARAETARDITKDAKISISSANGTIKRLRDRNVQTALQADSRKDPTVTVTMEKEPCAALYMDMGEKLLPFTVKGKIGGEWRELASNSGVYAQVYVEFEPCTELKICFESKTSALYIRELYLFSEGERDDSIVKLWQPPCEKADLLLLVAHPDDEVLWFGGLLPYYAGEKQMNVQTAYLTCSNSCRRIELLDSLWCCGVRNYPEIGTFRDIKTMSTTEIYKEWNKKKVDLFTVRLIRRYKPEVVVTHAFDGEYGHGAHKVCAYSMERALESAADPEFDPVSAEQYGVWQVKKFYVHKGGKDATVMDWRVPLERFGGETAFDVACDGYRKHVSQPQPRKEGDKCLYYVTPENDENSSFVYTLVHSEVGGDEQKNDLFEHIDRDAGAETPRPGSEGV